MKLTQVYLPRVFLDEIGFNGAIRKAVRIPTDPGLVELLQKLAPNFDWARAQMSPGIYQPPRWIGYWSSHSTAWASDGILKLAIPEADLLRQLFTQVHDAHYTHRKFLPFVSAENHDPSHMLLHDSELGRLYVGPFEQAEARLVRQPRPCL